MRIILLSMCLALTANADSARPVTDAERQATIEAFEVLGEMAEAMSEPEEGGAWRSEMNSSFCTTNGEECQLEHQIEELRRRPDGTVERLLVLAVEDGIDKTVEEAERRSKREAKRSSKERREEVSMGFPGEADLRTAAMQLLRSEVGETIVEFETSKKAENAARGTLRLGPEWQPLEIRLEPLDPPLGVKSMELSMETVEDELGAYVSRLETSAKIKFLLFKRDLEVSVDVERISPQG